MDWFERLTGFRETDYDDTRAKLKAEGTRLQSLINGKSYGVGELELVPLQALRERVKSAGAMPVRLKVTVVTGDVRQMHQSPENDGALFQVASQFKLAGDELLQGNARAWRHPHLAHRGAMSSHRVVSLITLDTCPCVIWRASGFHSAIRSTVSSSGPWTPSA